MSRGFAGGVVVCLVAAACIAASVRAEQPGASQSAVYLVQLTGPVLDTWKAAIADAGGDVTEYVPGFAFRVRMTGDAAARVRRLAFVTSVSPLRADDRFARGLVRDGRRLYVARLDAGVNAQQIAQALTSAGVQVRQRGARALMLIADGAQLDAVASIDGIASIENFAPRVKHNEYGAGAIVGGTLANGAGFDGSTQTIAVADTGLGGGSAATAHADIAASRVGAIFNWPGLPDFCFETINNDGAIDVDSGHGTHVATTALGAGNAAGIGRGTAPAAALVFQAVENFAVPSFYCSALYGLYEAYYLVGLPDDLGDLYGQGYQQGARIHSNSWGSAVAGEYNADAANTDAFVWTHRDITVVFSAGNSGTDTDVDGAVDPGSINSPGSAKNVITVGASENDRQSHWECDAALSYTTCAAQGGQNAIFSYGGAWPDAFAANPLRDDASAGNAEQMAAFSSRGPTADGRIKPDVVGPGTWTLSGYADLFQQHYDASANPVNGLFQYDGWGHPYDAFYKYMGGTSMAAPLVAGGAAVVRDFYQKSRTHEASAALVKAALINSAVDLLDENNDGVFDNADPIPNPHEGWGRIDLAGATDGTDQYFDELSPLATGTTASYTVEVTSAGAPLKATLVWTDYPGSSSAAAALVNDLDLSVTAPDGTTYRGNVFAGGWSAPGGVPDRLNNVENVFVFAAAAGTWTIAVSGYNVPNGPQPFALVLDMPAPSGGLPKVRLTVDDGTATEAGPTAGALRFTRSGDTASALTVAYDVGGSAIAGADYVALSGAVTIPEGAVDVVLPVEAIDDTLYESSESVIVALTATPAYIVGSPSSGSVSITSDDLPPDFVVSAFTTATAAAAGSAVTVTDTTKNQGSGPAPASETGFYLSSNTSWDTADQFLASRGVGALGAGASDVLSSSVEIPASTPPGTYYILAKADWSGSIPEVQEGNNARAGQALKIGPDLVVSALTVPSSAAVGGSLQVSDTTKNQGAAGAGATTTAFYLSANTTLDAGDAPLGSRAVGLLGPGAVSTAPTTLVIPADTAIGTYYVLAQADGGAVVDESVETNNLKVSGTVRIGADLTVTALAAPAKAGAGDLITINATTTNSGAGEAAESTTVFYLSLNTNVDEGDALLASRPVPALNAATSYAQTFDVTIPASTPTASYWVVAVADGLGDVAETNETNNIRRVKINVGPDLMVSLVQVPATASAGATVTVSDSTYNAGGGPAASTATSFYLSTNGALDAADVFLGTRTVPALAVGETQTAPVDLLIPAGTASGTYYVMAKADHGGVVTEVLETNNHRASVSFRLGPDLSVPVFTAPASAVRGVSFAVSDTTRNDGAAAAGPTTTSYYLSVNTALDASDLLLGSRPVGSLDAGASESAGATLVVPASHATGAFYLIAKADASNALAEGSETNNTRVRAFRVNP